MYEQAALLQINWKINTLTSLFCVDESHSEEFYYNQKILQYTKSMLAY